MVKIKADEKKRFNRIDKYKYISDSDQIRLCLDRTAKVI